MLEKNSITPAGGVSCPDKEEKTYSARADELIKTFESSANPMGEKNFTLCDVVFLLREDIDSLLKDSRANSVARIFNYIGFPLSENTLKIYHTKSRKEATEGHTGYDVLKQLILDTAAARSAQNCQDGMRAADALPAGESVNSMAGDAVHADVR